MLVRIQDGDYVVNLKSIASIDTRNEDSYEVTLVSGQSFTFEEDDLTHLKVYLKNTALN